MDQSQVVRAVQAGAASFCWVKLGEIEVMARPLRVGDRYAAVSARTAQLCAQALSDDAHDVSLTTTIIEDAIWSAATEKPEPHLISPQRMNIASTAALEEASGKLAQKLMSVPEDALVSYGKSWVLDAELASHPGRAANYGMPSKHGAYVSSDGRYKLWQPLGFRHDWEHYDYSQLLRLARRPRGSSLPGYARPVTVEVLAVNARTGPLRSLHLGVSGDDVLLWQLFLAGQGLFAEEASGTFGRTTQAATMAFQEREHLKVDGWAGNATLGHAMQLGLMLVAGLSPEEGPGWPPPPVTLQPLDQMGRQNLFGAFQFASAPTADNPEAIKIHGNWVQENIVALDVPELVGIRGAGDGRVSLHKLAMDPFRALLAAWQREGLMRLLLSWGGSYAPRFVRGSRTTLSQHAWGTAFDINTTWNALGAQPALRGKTGSVREFVPVANDLGWYWGGHFHARPDGMHFELARVP